MLFILGVLITLTAMVVIPRARLPRGMDAGNLGRMSEQWLAEYRASHST